MIIPISSREQGSDLAASLGALFIEVSSKNGSNVESACMQLVDRIQEYKLQIARDHPNLQTSPSEKYAGILVKTAGVPLRKRDKACCKK